MPVTLLDVQNFQVGLLFEVSREYKSSKYPSAASSLPPNIQRTEPDAANAKPQRSDGAFAKDLLAQLLVMAEYVSPASDVPMLPNSTGFDISSV